jgi:hypothetical protein
MCNYGPGPVPMDQEGARERGGERYSGNKRVGIMSISHVYKQTIGRHYQLYATQQDVAHQKMKPLKRNSGFGYTVFQKYGHRAQANCVWGREVHERLHGSLR